MYSGTTVWKFHRFYITQTLRKINFGLSRSAKSTILTHLEALNFDFYEFLHFLKDEIYQTTKFTAPEIAKTAGFTLLESPKLISRKISVIENSRNFHTVHLAAGFSEDDCDLRL